MPIIPDDRFYNLRNCRRSRIAVNDREQPFGCSEYEHISRTWQITQVPGLVLAELLERVVGGRARRRGAWSPANFHVPLPG